MLLPFLVGEGLVEAECLHVDAEHLLPVHLELHYPEGGNHAANGTEMKLEPRNMENDGRNLVFSSTYEKSNAHFFFKFSHDLL